MNGQIEGLEDAKTPQDWLHKAAEERSDQTGQERNKKFKNLIVNII